MDGVCVRARAVREQAFPLRQDCERDMIARLTGDRTLSSDGPYVAENR
jgi:hypothetical protein